MFHVYVEGASDASPDGLRKLAQAISQRYGLSSADLLTRLTAGRFRVKANVDKVTAETYMRALQEVGARVTVEEALERAQPSTPPANERTGASSLPPANAARPGGSSLPPANRANTPALGAAQRSGASSLPPANAARPAQPPLQSGLAAAFSSSTRAQSEGGFDALGGALSLSSVDGTEDEAAPASAAFAPPPESSAPVVVMTPAAAKSKPAAQPLDLFAPPDAEEAEAKVELATDEIEHRAKKMSVPPANVVASAPASAPNTPAMRRSAPSIQPPNVPVSRPAAADMPRGRFAAGVLLSILLGFVPAHLIAASRESSASAAIDANVVSTQNNAVEDEEAYRALDGFRAAQLAKKKSDKRTFAWQSMLIWAVVGAGVAYVYFRRIPWPAPKPDASA